MNSDGSFIFICQKLNNCLLFNVNRKWLIHFEPNTMQTTLLTKPHSMANWISRSSVPPQGHTACMSYICTALVHGCCCSLIWKHKLGPFWNIYGMFLVPDIYTVLIWRQRRINLRLKNVVNLNYVGLIEVCWVVQWNHFQTCLGRFYKLGIMCGENVWKEEAWEHIIVW